MYANDKFEQPQNPRATANIFEILTFGWMWNLFKTGQKRELEIKDVYTNLNDNKSSVLGNELEKLWKLEVIDASKLNKNPSLLKAIIKMIGPKMMLWGLLALFNEVFLKMPQPFLIGGLLAYFNPKGPHNGDLDHAYICAFCLTLSMLFSTIIFHRIFVEMHYYGMKIRVACCSMVFRKILRLSKTALDETNVGKIVNLLSNDVNRIDGGLSLLQYLWVGPLHLMLVTFLLWTEIGISSVLGIASLIMLVPFQVWLGKKSSEFRLKIAIRTDERIRLMNEIIMGIQVIKMYTWEKPFSYLSQFARKEEIQQIRGSLYIRATWMIFSEFHTRLALFITILGYVLLGYSITSQKIYIVTSCYTLMRGPMQIFPQSIGQIGEMITTIKRLQSFLLSEEKNDQVSNILKMTKGTEVQNIINTNSTSNNDKLGIVVSNVTAKWTEKQSDNTLQKINLTVRPGRLVAVIGPVGAGKSSLVQAILQELPISVGDICVHGVVSYASQEIWLFTGSIQQNILFGSSMNTYRYKEVIKVCQLEKDFQQLPYGDKTQVGDRGISLSGGQRARINLARAVYRQADIYLLDDPLSAVDTHVGKYIFKECIKGFLKEKSCVLITHQVQYLTDVDQIVLMENGNILTEGTYQKLQASNLEFTKLLQSFDKTLVENKNNIENGTKHKANQNFILNGKDSFKSIGSSVKKVQVEKFQEEPIGESEMQTSGNISIGVYSSYFSAGGGKCTIIFLVFICVFTQLLASSGDLWITHWINLEEHVLSHVSITNNSMNVLMRWSTSRQNCIYVFIGLTFFIIIALIVKYAAFVTVCIQASINLHNTMFNAITRASMSFFNTNSSGRILNRFSKDIGALDDILPIALMDCIRVGLNLLGILVTVGLMNIYLIIPTFILVIVFYKLRYIYLSTSRCIKRLEGITRSPVFTYINTTIQGFTTIRAFQAEDIVSKEFDEFQDIHSSTWYLFITSSRAFGFWLDVICLIYISIVSLSFLVIANDKFGANVGLAITQAYSLAGMCQWGVRQSAEVENNMTSVERILEFTNVPQEASFESPIGKKPPSDWPSKGQIKFINFYLRYSTNTPFVVKNLNLNIESMQKVGIVGRTGAGKSSLIGALFRFALTEGNIIIDGIEIHQLGLYDLRSKISIIPQEPVLFSGTLRKNLDPFNEYPDHVLWNALAEVELKDVIEDFTNGLNFKISEGGSNLSIGQRQLVCLARAIVNNNKILVMDEATANVDPQTDFLIQNTIRNKFQTCTVLTVAHRLNTVMDSDKIFVLDAGEKVEFEHPHILLKNKNGYFYKMVEQTGQTSANLLHNIALENYKAKNTMNDLSLEECTKDVKDNFKKTS